MSNGSSTGTGLVVSAGKCADMTDVEPGKGGSGVARGSRVPRALAGPPDRACRHRRATPQRPASRLRRRTVAAASSPAPARAAAIPAWLRPDGTAARRATPMLRSVRPHNVRRSGDRAAERQQQACHECGFHRMYFQPKSMPGRQNSGWNRPRASAATDKTTIKSSHPHAGKALPAGKNRAVDPARQGIRLPGASAEVWRPRRDSNSQPMELKSIALSS